MYAIHMGAYYISKLEFLVLSCIALQLGRVAIKGKTKT